MIELLEFLFVTEKDQCLYFNQDALINELLNEHQFSCAEVKAALEWFAPIVEGSFSPELDSVAVRAISIWEKQHLPLALIEQILQKEREQLINSKEREVLLDRLSLLGLDLVTDATEGQTILEGLIFHLQNYKYQLFKQDGQLNPYYYAANFTLH